MPAHELKDARSIAGILTAADRSLAAGDIAQAHAHYVRCFNLVRRWVDDLVSDDPEVARRAASVTLPPGIDPLALAVGPYRGLLRTAPCQGHLDAALEAGERAMALYTRFAPGSAAEPECLDELAGVAQRMGYNDYAQEMFALAELKRIVLD